MPTLFANLAASRSWHISSQKIAQIRFNWDIAEHKTNFLQNPSFFEALERKDLSIPLIVLDEIHKYKDWKNYLKGIYDQLHDKYRFLISGSGRLDIYQQGGDSPAGRYFLFHLWSFTISELGGKNREIGHFLNDPLQTTTEHTEELKEIWAGLSELSGFPEPYLAGRKTTY